MVELKDLKITDVFADMKVLWCEFEQEHLKFVEKNNAAAGRRARKAVTNLKKLVTTYRKLSTAEADK